MIRSPKIFLFLAWLLFACNQVSTSHEPQIRLISVEPGEVREFMDSVYFRVGYFDADGDLGENSNEKMNLFILDERNNVLTELRIPKLSPSSSGIPIQGIFNFSIPYVVRTKSQGEDTLVFSLWVKDRMGNSSNQLKTTAIRVKP